MGLPDHPENNDNDYMPWNNSAPILIHNLNLNDDNENEDDENEYSGYEPLGHAGGGFNIPYATDDDDDDDSDESDNEVNDLETAQVQDPQAPCPEAEIEREVWNAPRPSELNIELDTTRTEQIMSAMAGISLPTSAIPDWAQNVPEEKWKEDLLVKIRGKQGTSNSEK